MWQQSTKKATYLLVGCTKFQISTKYPRLFRLSYIIIGLYKSWKFIPTILKNWASGIFTCVSPTWPKNISFPWASGICLCKPLQLIFRKNQHHRNSHGYQYSDPHWSKLGKFWNTHTVHYSHFGLLRCIKRGAKGDQSPNIQYLIETNSTESYRQGQTYCCHSNMEQKELDGIGPSPRHHFTSDLAGFQLSQYG